MAEKIIDGKILITGIGGLIGSHLQNELTHLGYKIIGIDNFSTGFKRNILPTTTFYQADCRSKLVIDKVFDYEKPEIVFHCAADAAEGRSQFTPVNATENGLMSSVNIFTSAIKHEVKRIIYFSSIAVYGDQEPPFTEEMSPKPIDVYAVNKRAGEEILKILCDVHSVEYVIFRPYNIFGELQNMADPYRNVVGIFMNRILNKQAPLIYGDGEQTRAFSYIKNVIPIFIKAMTANVSGETFNIGPEKPYTVNELAQMVLDVMGSKLEPEHIPARLHEVKMAYCDNSKARQMLGYEDKYSVEEGLKEMAVWAKKMGYQKPVYLSELELENNAPNVWLKKKI